MLLRRLPRPWAVTIDWVGGIETRTLARVPPHQYFLLGDNRIHSCDSRAWGTVPRHDLIGPVLVRYWPPTRISIR